jgi:hypothetical protein
MQRQESILAIAAALTLLVAGCAGEFIAKAGDGPDAGENSNSNSNSNDVDTDGGDGGNSLDLFNTTVKDDLITYCGGCHIGGSYTEFSATEETLYDGLAGAGLGYITSDRANSLLYTCAVNHEQPDCTGSATTLEQRVEGASGLVGDWIEAEYAEQNAQ